MLTASYAKGDDPAIREMIEEQMRIAGLPGLSVAIIRPGKDDYVEGFGLRAVNSPVPVDENTLFKLNSVSKSITAMGIARLIDAGKLDWTDRIIDHYPEFRLSDPWVTREVTFEDAMSHRVGVEATDWMEDLPGLSLEGAIYRLRYLPQVTPFRTQYLYDNYMFSVAGVAAGRLVGGWDELVRTEVLEPLGMNDSITRIERHVAKEEITACHECELDHAPRGLEAVDGQINIAAPHMHTHGQARLSHWRSSNSRPAGAVWSSAVDMARYAKLYLGEGEVDGREVLSRETFRQLMVPRIVTGDAMPVKRAHESEYDYRSSQLVGLYAQGWNLSHYMGRLLVHHGGASIGYQSAVLLLPDEGIGIALLSNLREGRSKIVLAIAMDVLDHLLGLSPVAWTNAELARICRQAEAGIREPDPVTEGEAQSPPSLPLSAYVGKYLHPAYGEITIRAVDNARLELSQGRQRRGVLRPAGHDTFELTWNGVRPGPVPVRFAIGMEGHAVELVLNGQTFSLAMPDEVE